MTEPAPTPWWRNDAVVTATLVAIAGLGFTVTHFINKAYERREDAFARRWYQRGDEDLTAGKPQDAVADFRTALMYSRDNPHYRLRLAEALAANDDTSQAIAYFLNLWEKQPGSGPLNLQLARLYARLHQARAATQHYNAAIYGIWPGNPIIERRQARVEYIAFLQQENLNARAQAEAVALAASVPPDDLEGHLQAADLLLKTGDPTRAFAEYTALLRHAPAQAAFGAGQSAYQMGEMHSAVKYLQAALQHGSTAPQAKSLLLNAQKVVNADPDQRHISSSERGERTSAAYDQAGDRLQECAMFRNQVLEANPPISDLQKLYTQWTSLSASVRKAGRDSDIRDSIMDLVFRVEDITAQQCSEPAAGSPDWALLTLYREREGGHP
jgi:tetratricopeptide (TPR) repeat protein